MPSKRVRKKGSKKERIIIKEMKIETKILKTMYSKSRKKPDGNNKKNVIRGKTWLFKKTRCSEGKRGGG